MGMDFAMAFTPQRMQGLRRIGRDLAWETMNIFSPVEIHDALDWMPLLAWGLQPLTLHSNPFAFFEEDMGTGRLNMLESLQRPDLETPHTPQFPLIRMYNLGSLKAPRTTSIVRSSLYFLESFFAYPIYSPRRLSKVTSFLVSNPLQRKPAT